MATVTLNRPNLYPFKHLLLMPGDNDVSDADVKMLRKEAGVMRDVERGILSIGDDKPTRGKRRPRQEQTDTPQTDEPSE